MGGLPFISDYLQYRCNRLADLLDADDPVRDLNTSLWRSFKEERRSLDIPSDNEPLEIGIYSVQQGPTRAEAFFDWQHLPGSYSHVQRLLAAHASLRCALAGSEADKIIGVADVNLRELSQEQIYQFCEQVARWWDSNERTFATPFSRMAYVMKNWLDGVYGEKPGGLHVSLDAIQQLAIDQRELVTQSALCLHEIIRDVLSNGDHLRVAVVGEGLWSETVSVEFGLQGVECVQYVEMPAGEDYDLVFLLHTHNVVDPELAEHVACRVLVELLPDQINPEADSVLFSRGVVVVPDLICSCAPEIVENWWIGGRRVADWQRMLAISFADLWKRTCEKQAQKNISFHDAALLLAFDRLAERWTE